MRADKRGGHFSLGQCVVMVSPGKLLFFQLPHLSHQPHMTPVHADRKCLGILCDLRDFTELCCGNKCLSDVCVIPYSFLCCSNCGLSLAYPILLCFLCSVKCTEHTGKREYLVWPVQGYCFRGKMSFFGFESGSSEVCSSPLV